MSDDEYDSHRGLSYDDLEATEEFEKNIPEFSGSDEDRFRNYDENFEEKPLQYSSYRGPKDRASNPNKHSTEGQLSEEKEEFSEGSGKDSRQSTNYHSSSGDSNDMETDVNLKTTIQNSFVPGSENRELVSGSGSGFVFDNENAGNVLVNKGEKFSEGSEHGSQQQNTLTLNHGKEYSEGSGYNFEFDQENAENVLASKGKKFSEGNEHGFGVEEQSDMNMLANKGKKFREGSANDFRAEQQNDMTLLGNNGKEFSEGSEHKFDEQPDGNMDRERNPYEGNLKNNRFNKDFNNQVITDDDSTSVDETMSINKDNATYLPEESDREIHTTIFSVLPGSNALPGSDEISPDLQRKSNTVSSISEQFRKQWGPPDGSVATPFFMFGEDESDLEGNGVDTFEEDFDLQDDSRFPPEFRNWYRAKGKGHSWRGHQRSKAKKRKKKPDAIIPTNLDWRKYGIVTVLFVNNLLLIQYTH